MKPKKYKVNLNAEQRKELEGITKRGKHSAATIKRANMLLALDENGGVVDKAGRNSQSVEDINSDNIQC